MTRYWPDRKTWLGTLSGGLVGAAIAVGFVLLARWMPTAPGPTWYRSPAYAWSLWKAGLYGAGVGAVINFPLAWGRQLVLR